MMSIHKLLSKRRTMLALTGVTPEEFTALVPTFESAMNLKKEHAFIENPKRQRKSGSGIKPFCKTIEEQLLFILLYFKCYPTFDVLSFLYDRERSNVWRRYDFLAPILESALGRKLALPARQITSIEEFWKAFPEAKELFIDGTERPIRRPKDKQKQKANYSGKKKRNTKKNLVIATKRKRINYLSPTVEGKERIIRITWFYPYSLATLNKWNFLSLTPLTTVLKFLSFALNDSAEAFVLRFTK